MDITFKLNGRDFNHPAAETHIKIQKGFIEKLESVLHPIYEQMNSEVGGICINYNDNGKLIKMTWGGYSFDSNVKMNILLRGAFK
jgi:hypothetical protein